jgi:hypothetical protein
MLRWIVHLSIAQETLWEQLPNSACIQDKATLLKSRKEQEIVG